jgi:hypothetical protein
MAHRISSNITTKFSLNRKAKDDEKSWIQSHSKSISTKTQSGDSGIHLTRSRILFIHAKVSLLLFRYSAELLNERWNTTEEAQKIINRQIWNTGQIISRNIHLHYHTMLRF